MKAKTFDCVDMKHAGAEKVQNQVAGMTREREVTFWKERSHHLRKRQQALKSGQPKSAA